MVSSHSVADDLWYGFHLLFLSVLVAGSITLVSSVVASNVTLVIIPFTFTVAVVILRRISIWLGTLDIALLSAGRGEVRALFLTPKVGLFAFLTSLAVIVGLFF